MSGLSPKLPVRRDPVDGFALTKTYSEMIKQNFKNLVLTSPGERVMDPNFGVGIRRYLFEQKHLGIYDEIKERIITQARIYMPFVEIRNVFFPAEEENSGLRENINSLTTIGKYLNPEDSAPNRLNIQIAYAIVPIGVFDALEIRVDVI